VESLYVELLEGEVRRLRAEKESLVAEMADYQRASVPRFNRIAAIKRLRLILPSLDLKEAKDAVDAAFESGVG